MTVTATIADSKITFAFEATVSKRTADRWRLLRLTHAGELYEFECIMAFDKEIVADSHLIERLLDIERPYWEKWNDYQFSLLMLGNLVWFECSVADILDDARGRARIRDEASLVAVLKRWANTDEPCSAREWQRWHAAITALLARDVAKAKRAVRLLTPTKSKTPRTA